MEIEETKKAILGKWHSISPEIRPSNQKNENGSAKPFYLTRDFEYLAGDRFTLTILNFADPYGKVPLARIAITGHITWQGDHPIAEGAQKVNFTADEAYEVTPLIQGFADLLNQVAGTAYDKWKVGEVQSIFGKSFLPFGLTEGQHFKEYDLIYFFNDMLFWGARNVDGRGFDTEETRPTNLQIPMTRIN
ncbi:hypothetical protein KXD93_21925 [Mucilaginibacter sp. BJC16-A38]|uniref:hypothetical protein n=1 Tax=Mucilaginibacter phenanthrenivorans TaxID=1234842 RepID=UPI0021580C0A|nr:hypothetical protein [Mucilaginibacter phenanthrenivorans]MCR8560327.1 hypothetical protein [Mucilaginibacter phenanthrenivorans]